MRQNQGHDSNAIEKYHDFFYKLVQNFDIGIDQKTRNGFRLEK